MIIRPIDAAQLDHKVAMKVARLIEPDGSMGLTLVAYNGNASKHRRANYLDRTANGYNTVDIATVHVGVAGDNPLLYSAFLSTSDSPVFYIDVFYGKLHFTYQGVVC